MTAPRTGATRPAPRLGRLPRWRLTEPLRLYVWPAVAFLLLAALVIGVNHGLWLALVAGSPAVPILAALEAARTSVYSPAGAVAAVRDAMAQR